MLRLWVEAMIRFAVAAVLSVVSSDASAIVRYMVQGMTCAEVQQTVERDGIAILYRQGKAGVALYDRFVKDGSFCNTGYTAAREGIAAADTNDCRVAKCIETGRFGD
ncbi:MAG: hypothetical protein K0S21_1958 [Rhizobiaceae bacterium]|nr:hypothetical protein [Rhizobiaceae bacterium]